MSELVRKDGRLWTLGARPFSISDGTLYETDFSNFDYTNLVDYPMVGNPVTYTYSSYKPILSDGYFVVRGCDSNVVYVESFRNLTHSLLCSGLPVSMETTISRASSGGYWGGMSYGDIKGPAWNTWSSDRGWGVYSQTSRTSVISLFNNFSRFESDGWYKSSFYDSWQWGIDVNRTGVITVYPDGKVGVGLEGKKALLANYPDYLADIFHFYNDDVPYVYVKHCRIWVGDGFSELD